MNDVQLYTTLAGGAAFVIVCGGLLALGRALSRGQERVADRLSRLGAGPAIGLDEERGGLVDLLRRVGAYARPKGEKEMSELRQKLQHAGYSGAHAVEIFLGARLAAGLALLLLYLVVWRPGGSAGVTMFFSMMWLVIGFILGPRIWLNRAIEARKRDILSSLPDTLDLLLTCLDAGQPLHAAIERVAHEMKLAAPVIGDELGQTVAHIRAGMAQEVAFRKLAERAGVDELSVLASLLFQAQQYGTSIAQTLRVHADSLRAHRLQKAEQTAATAAVRMTLPMIFFILPALLSVLLGPAIVQFAHQLVPALTGVEIPPTP